MATLRKATLSCYWNGNKKSLQLKKGKAAPEYVDQLLPSPECVNESCAMKNTLIQKLSQEKNSYWC